MQPIKIDFIEKVLAKTALNRDGPPKVAILLEIFKDYGGKTQDGSGIC
jgi:hypothetical protein